jgi:hypothetical protein
MAVQQVPDAKTVDPMEECEAARRLAEFHRIGAANLSPESERRALMFAVCCPLGSSLSIQC